MYHRARTFIRDRLRDVSLRVRAFNLPPLATHLACFLMGTLLFEPDATGRMPSGVLIPWSAQKIVGGIQRTADYSLVSRNRHCLLSADPLRIWIAAEKKIYIVAARSKGLPELTQALGKADASLEKKPSSPLPNCETSNAIVYP